MTDQFLVHKDPGSFPIKHWTRGVSLDDNALDQLKNLAKLPFIHKHVAVMPDVHWGMGSTIGSVIATDNVIIPAAVGVDIGCGMAAVRTTLRADQLPDNLLGIRTAIESMVPHGRTNDGGSGDRGAWGTPPDIVAKAWSHLEDEFKVICDKHPKIERSNNVNHLGTLGGGNHFVEICLDKEDHVWIMLHSGSRGVGNRIGTHFISKAKEAMKLWHIKLDDDNLAYLPDGTDAFKDYVQAVNWAQDYAFQSRGIMMNSTLSALKSSGLPAFSVTDEAINCHHNYVQKERHYGKNVWLTRKGAVRAREGDLGIIPGSMGAKSFIVRGKGNRESFSSCSHGAGRVMARNEAKRTFTVEDQIRATEGVECRKDAGVIDEHPDCYKDIDAVMAAQSDLVEIVHELKQVVCVKG